MTDKPHTKRKLPDRKRMVFAARTAVACTIVAVIACTLLATASHAVVPKNNQKEFGMLHPEANGIQGERSETIDVLFIGDSEAFSTFSPMQLWKEHGFTSYVSATSSQQLPYGLTLLKRAFQQQRPRVVVFETNSIYAPFTPIDGIRRLLMDAFPVFEYHDRWKSLTKDDLFQAAKSTWTDDLKGFRIDKRADAADASRYMEPADSTAKVPEENRLYLRRMIELCQEHDAAPVLVSVPSTVNWNIPRHNGMAQLARELGVSYHDFNLDPYRSQLSIDWRQDTADKGDHLNYRGACKATHLIGTLLKAEFDLPDHRADKAFSSWDEALARYETRVAQQEPR